jgi:tripartite-type tricarboxylate transporter receptor subunit TctC
MSAIVRCAVALFLAAPLAAAAQAQSYPSKPVRIIAPFPPAGGIDGSARIVAQALSESFGQQFLVDNRAGASGRIGTELAAKAAPDGYTLLMGSVGPNAVIPAVDPKLPYAASDFQPVSIAAMSDYMLAVHPSLPVKSVPELIALAKTKRGKLDFASTGNLGGPHLAGELFKLLAKVDMVHVAYKGGSPQITALLSGEVSTAFPSFPSALVYVKSGRVRALGTTGPRRNSALPELPRIGEYLPGYEVTQWYGVLVPAATPKEIVARLHDEIARALKTPKVHEQMSRFGFEARSSTPEEFSALIKVEMQKWGKVVKSSGVPLE